MPIYMDIHHVPGAEALDLAEAHRKDILLQNEYHCKCMTYWLDETRGSAFCLIEGPDKSAVEELHRKAHGFIPFKLIEVKNEVVESFLGRIRDPEETSISDNGLKVFSDPAFRILLVTDITDPVLLRHKLGPEKANELLQMQNTVIRKAISTRDGLEAEHTGHAIIASFSAAVDAVSCALDIHRNLSAQDRNLTDFKMGINAGEPVSKSDKLFGDTIQLAGRLCTVANHQQIIIASAVKDLLARDDFQMDQATFKILSPREEILLESLFNILETHWQDPDFAVSAFCRNMSMSKSQLYRKTMALWNLAPNLLLMEYKLHKARELLKKQGFNIAQTTFDAGFSSPSYFTKCFKKKFGLLPAKYQQALQ